MADTFLKDLELLIRSRHAILFLKTEERERTEGLLKHTADMMRLPLFVWTRSKGLKEAHQLAAAKETLNPVHALQEIERWQRPGLYAFQGLDSDLEDANVITKLRDAAKAYRRLDGAIILMDLDMAVPPALRVMSTVLTVPPPSDEEYRDLVKHLYRDLSQRMTIELQLTRAELNQLVNNLRGLTLLEAEKILTKAMVEDGVLGAHDIRKIVGAKKQILEREGLLEYYPVEESLADIAGLAGLKSWLKKRRAIVQAPEKAREFGLSFPKGILLVGVQGCGKSLCAKAVAMDWQLPLLRMDPGSLYNKYIGESEKNFQRAVAVAEKMAPVILWIDEIEKAFASGGDMDGGLSQRVLGGFLSWLQDRNGDVFVMATANDVSKLPPELIRKGRFDELFFVDLPPAEAREAIFAIHLKKRKRDPEQFELPRLVAASEGFSGAEIEQAVVSGLYTAFSEGAELSTDLLLEEIKETRPLSVTMHEKIAKLRAWASERTVSAN